MTRQRKNYRLNAPVKNLIVYAGSDENAKVICSARGDIAGTLKVDQHSSSLLKSGLKGDKLVPTMFISKRNIEMQSMIKQDKSWFDRMRRNWHCTGRSY